MTFKLGDKVKYKGDCQTFSGAMGGHKPAEGVVVGQEGIAGVTSLRLTSGISGVAKYPAGTVVNLFTRNMELIEDKEETVTFKVGDRVTVKGYETYTNPAFEGRTGTVTDTYGDSDSRRVKFEDGKQYDDGTFSLKYLVPAEKPFTFEDIQKGDKIRRTETWDTGSVRVFEGVVTDLNAVRAYTKEALLVGYIHDKDNTHMTYELLERPEPKEPELWENREPGDKIATYDQDGKVDRIFTKQDDGLWNTIVMNTSGKLQKGFTRSDHELGAHLKKYGNKVHLI